VGPGQENPRCSASGVFRTCFLFAARDAKNKQKNKQQQKWYKTNQNKHKKRNANEARGYFAYSNEQFYC